MFFSALFSIVFQSWDIPLHSRQKPFPKRKSNALGGITAANIDKTKYYGFGGVALLGDIWSRTADKNFEEYVRKIVEICHV